MGCDYLEGYDDMDKIIITQYHILDILRILPSLTKDVKDFFPSYDKIKTEIKSLTPRQLNYRPLFAKFLKFIQVINAIENIQKNVQIVKNVGEKEQQNIAKLKKNKKKNTIEKEPVDQIPDVIELENLEIQEMFMNPYKVTDEDQQKQEDFINKSNILRQQILDLKNHLICYDRIPNKLDVFQREHELGYNHRIINGEADDVNIVEQFKFLEELVNKINTPKNVLKRKNSEQLLPNKLFRRVETNEIQSILDNKESSELKLSPIDDTDNDDSNMEKLSKNEEFNIENYPLMDISDNEWINDKDQEEYLTISNTNDDVKIYEWFRKMPKAKEVIDLNDLNGGRKPKSKRKKKNKKISKKRIHREKVLSLR